MTERTHSPHSQSAAARRRPANRAAAIPNAASLESATIAGELTSPLDMLAVQRTLGNRAARSIQRKPIKDGELDSNLSNTINQSRGGGQPLPDRVRGSMESAFQSDFSGVRVHADQQADTLNRSVQAKAFTLGSDIYFSTGTYNPTASAGQELLAHELTHVVQQGGKQNRLQGKLTLGPVGDRYEQEADRVAKQVVRGGSQPAVQRAPQRLQGKWPSRKKKTAPVISGPTNVTLNNRAITGPQDIQQQLGYQRALIPAGISAPQRTPIADPAGTQTSAEARVNGALMQAQTLAAQGKTLTDELKQGSALTDEQTAQRKTGARREVKRLQRAEAAVHKATGVSEGLFANIVKQIEDIQFDLGLNGRSLERYIEAGDQSQVQLYARLALGMADNAESRVQEGRKQLTGMGHTAAIEGAVARSKLEKRDWPSVEMSASDAAMELEKTKFEVVRLYDYIKMDHDTVKKLVADKTEAVTAKYGKYVAARIIAVGAARGGLPSRGVPITDQQAISLTQDSGGPTSLGGEIESGLEYGQEIAQSNGQKLREAAINPPPPPPPTKGNKYLDPSLKEGAGQGFKNFLKSTGKTIGGYAGKGVLAVGGLFAKPFAALGRGLDRNVFRRDHGKMIEKARLIQGLELMAKFDATNEARLEQAAHHGQLVITMHDESLATYDDIDRAKKIAEEKGDSTGLDTAIISAGKSWSDVAQAAVYRDQLQKHQTDIATESDKFSKYGDRAMGTGKMVGLTAGAAVAGAALKIGTLGMLHVEKAEVGGGYSAKLQVKTIVDDFKKAVAQFKEASSLKGLGGKKGAMAYAVMQAISTALGLVKTIAGSLAIFTLAVPQVSAVFTTISLYTAIVKAAIDLALLIWTAVASKMTKDPRARSKLKGRIAEHGLAFGESAASVAGAGIMAGVSGDLGAFMGQQIHTSIFSAEDTTKGTHAGVGGHWINDHWSQNVMGHELEYGSYIRTGLDQAVKQGPTLINTVTGGIVGAVGTSETERKEMHEKQYNQLNPGVVHGSGTDVEGELRDKTKDAKGKVTSLNTKIKDAVMKAETHLAEKAKKKNKGDEGTGAVLNALPQVTGGSASLNDAMQTVPETI